jgi:1,4-dihydroxy-2-naphthoate octaprenyltransferase
MAGHVAAELGSRFFKNHKPELLIRLGRRRVRNFFTYLLICLLIYLFTYLLTPWSRVLLEKLTGSQLVKKFPAFCRTRRFITAFASARHLSLS